MPSINYIEADTADGVRREVVKDARDREAKARAALKSGTNLAAAEKKALERVAADWKEFADQWESMHLGHPLKPPAKAS